MKSAAALTFYIRSKHKANMLTEGTYHSSEAMAQVCKLEATVELKTPAEKFYQFVKSQSQHIPNTYTDKVHGIEVHNGDWNTPGCVKVWKYKLDGNDGVFKERVEADDRSKSLTYVAVGGNVLELYKSYKVTLKVENGSYKVRVEYEKHNENDPAPNKYLQFFINLLNDVDGNLITKG